MNRDKADPIKFLEERYLEKRAKNPAYSLRAFAKFLDISPARLSQVMTGARTITKGQIKKIAVATSLTPAQSAALSSSIKKGRPDVSTTSQFLELSECVYKALSDVNASSVLAALPLSKSKSADQVKFLAKKLGLTTIEVKRIFDVLTASSLIGLSDNQFIPTHASVASASSVKSSARRKYHRAILNKAIDSIEAQNLDERDLSSITLLMDPANMDLAKEKIKKFRRELSELLESSGKPSEVYALNIQLFKLSK